jgi:hypothetical protein
MYMKSSINNWLHLETHYLAYSRLLKRNKLPVVAEWYQLGLKPRVEELPASWMDLIKRRNTTQHFTCLEGIVPLSLSQSDSNKLQVCWLLTKNITNTFQQNSLQWSNERSLSVTETNDEILVHRCQICLPTAPLVVS